MHEYRKEEVDNVVNIASIDMALSDINNQISVSIIYSFDIRL